MALSFVFGRFCVHLDRRELLADRSHIELGTRAFDILISLMEARGELLSKNDLMSRVWGSTIVEESTLQSHVCALRNALKEERNRISTVSRRGYRFLGQYQVIERNEDSVQDPPYPGHSRLGGESLSIPRARTNLPNMMSPLIGRSGNLCDLVDLIGYRRLVTLTGVGGSGKTRLALEVAQQMLPGFPDGAWFADMACLSDSCSINAAIARVLELQIDTIELSGARLGATLGSRHLLLVLDNCDHMLDAAAKSIEELLHTTSAVHIVTTTREPLGIEGEQVYQVPPLESPPEHVKGVSELLAYDSVRYFCARMREMNHAFSLDEVDAVAVAAICRRLDGLPLALELAAVRAATLGVRPAAMRLDRIFELLTQGRRTSPARHRTFRATLEWSYELLSDDERRVLRRLAVFSGGFTLEAACALVGSDVVAGGAEVTDCVARLLAKSWIAADIKEPPVRYRLLQTTRAYLLERLAESNEIDDCRQRHAQYFRDVLQAGGSGRPRQGTQTFGAEIENLRTALAWAFSVRGDPSLGTDLAVRSAAVWLEMYLFDERLSRADKAVTQSGSGGGLGKRNETALLSMLACILATQGAGGPGFGAGISGVCKLVEQLPARKRHLNELITMWRGYQRAPETRGHYDRLTEATKGLSRGVLANQLAEHIRCGLLPGKSFWLRGFRDRRAENI